MAKQSEGSSRGGIGVVGLLGVLFVALKLIGVIDWSWWWVTAPFWSGIVAALVILVIYLTCVGLLAVIKVKKGR
jgi:hypothetical protein